MLPVNEEALAWLKKIRLTLLGRKISVSATVRFVLSEIGLQAARRAKPGVTEEYTTPHTAITRELASASRRAQRFLRRKGLSREDREDIIGDALLWCLENRDSYSLTTTLDTWFVNAVRDAYKAHKRIEERSHGNL